MSRQSRLGFARTSAKPRVVQKGDSAGINGNYFGDRRLRGERRVALAAEFVPISIPAVAFHRGEARGMYVGL